jgi:NADH-quinone oxidoreductase subunit F
MPEEKEKNLKEIFKEIEEKKCVIQQGIMLLDEFISGPMCARCLPCPMGSYEMRLRLKKLSEGEGTEDDINALKEIAPKILATSMCKKGKDTAQFIIDTTDSFSDEYAAHISGSCSQKECIALYVYRVIPEKCTMCGDCLDACKDFAIIGEKKMPYKSGYLPFEIVEKRCTRCGECLKVCKYDAIEIVDVGELQPVGG